ncbi:MAG: class I SAM-dependent methyltransferase [Candidatus Omnitrophota bacterium]|nr:class I SAM-dependent methyltransferase [Candidatus Omnitrophota bacterium]
MLKEDRLLNEVRHGKFLAMRGAGYIWNWDTPAGKERWSRRIGMLTKHITSSMHVLEIGCGTGYLTKELAKTRAMVTAIDISPDLIDIARSAVNEMNVTFKIENAHSITFPENTFDTILGSSILHHLDPNEAIRELYRVLKKGGSIFFTEPNMMNPQVFIQKNVPLIKKMLGDSAHETAFFKWDLRKRLRTAGFTDIIITPFDFLHPHIPKSLLAFIRPICNLAEKIPLVSEISGSLYIRARK